MERTKINKMEIEILKKRKRKEESEWIYEEKKLKLFR